MKALTVVALVLLVAFSLGATESPDHPTLPDRHQLSDHHRAEGAARRAAIAAGALPPGLAKTWAPVWEPPLYDVERYSLDIHLNPQRALLSGSVEIELAALVDDLAEIVLDADQALRILGVELLEDPALPHDSACSLSFLHSDDLLHVELPRALAAGEKLRILVSYGGNAGHDGLGVGWQRMANGAPLITSFAQPLGARMWWPCNDRPDDKALVDMRVTAPSNLTVASNGLQEERVLNADGSATTWYSSRYPISTYLVVMNVSDYHYSTVDYTALDGVTTMPVEIFAYPELAGEASEFFANTPNMIAAYAERFGEYPFLDEKYGNCLTPFGGGMEHQTLCSYGAAVLGLSWLDAHEVSHQWWGDWVTYDTWQEIWLAEGLASYSEWLWLEATEPDEVIPYALGQDGLGYFLGPLYDNPVQFSVTCYDKGAWTYHMLRWVLGDDAFFAGLGLYRAAHGGGVAGTDELRAAMEEAGDTELGWFFDQWVYGENRPHYQYEWQALADPAVRLTVRQVQTNAGLFRMPVEVEVTTSAGVERHVVDVDAVAETTVDIPVAATPTEVVLDPDFRLLADIGRAEDPDVELGPDYPGPFDFGINRLGQTVGLTIPLTNVGGSTLSVDEVVFWANNGFSLVSPGEVPFEVAPGETVDLELSYRNPSLNVNTEFLILVSNDPSRGGWTIIPLQGGGVLSEAPQLMPPQAVDFGQVPVGGVAEDSFSLRNFGAEPLIVSLALDHTDFAIGSASSLTLAAQQTVDVYLRYSPSAVGEAAAELQLSTNDPLHPELTVALSGEGIAAPRLELEPPVLSFGVAPAGAEASLWLVNGGDLDLVISGLEVDEPFAVASSWTLPLTIPAGASQELKLSFAGEAEGEARGALRILSNDPGVPWVVVPLSARTATAELSRWVIPAAARTPGLGGAYWQSSAALLNPGSSELAVDLSLHTAAGHDGTAKDLSLSVPAGNMRYLSDIVEAVGRDDGVGGLVLDASAPGLVAVSRSFTSGAGGSYGQYIGAVAEDELQQGARDYVLAGLAGNGGFHTNFGLLNLGDAALSVGIDVYAADGSALGTVVLDAAAGAFAQTTAAIARLTGDEVRGGFAVARSDDPAARYALYGSVVDDGSHDPTFVAPVAAGDQALDVVVPAVASNPGLNDTVWRSQLSVVNLGADDAEVELELHPRGSAQPASATLTVPAGAAVYLDDVVAGTFGRSGSGWLGVSSSSASLVVSSRTYNDDPSGSYGQLVPAVAATRLVGPQETVVLAGLSSADGARTNLGIASAAAVGTSFTLQWFAEDGSAIGDMVLYVAAGSLMQVDRVLADPFTGRAWATLVCNDPEARFTAYASVVDGGTGDPIFIPGVVATATAH